MPFDAASYIMGKNASGGGGSSVTVEPLSVTQNGEYTAPDGKAYTPVTVNVPNSYSASDEGKVVDGGVLVAQTSLTVTQNGTVDTTLNNEVVVNVPTGGGSSYTLLASAEFIVSTTSTSETSVGTITLPLSAITKDKMIYVRIRDKAGPRTGYFYGFDAFFTNYSYANNSTLPNTCTQAARQFYTIGSNGLWSMQVSQYGVYPKQLGASSSSATSAYVSIYSKVGTTTSSHTDTIDGTFLVEVYALEWPGNVSPFAS